MLAWSRNCCQYVHINAPKIFQFEFHCTPGCSLQYHSITSEYKPIGLMYIESITHVSQVKLLSLTKNKRHHMEQSHEFTRYRAHIKRNPERRYASARPRCARRIRDSNGSRFIFICTYCVYYMFCTLSAPRCWQCADDDDVDKTSNVFAFYGFIKNT